jgi:hypothetical protein
MSNLFFFQICDLNFLEIFLFPFFLELFALFFHFFPNKNCQVKKFQNQKNMLVGEGGGGGGGGFKQIF